MKGRSNALLRLGYQAARSRAFRNSDDFFEDFRTTLTRMGGVYAKFLQGVLLGYAVNKGKKISDHELDVYEDNPDPGYSVQLLHSLLGSAARRVQITDPSPLGVGSYSAVYSGLLDGVKPVVIKILRPGIHDEIKYDLSFLRKLTYLLKLADIKIAAVDITQFYGSFKKACIKETDFASEIALACEMFERYKDHPTLVVPRTYQDLSNDHIIVQERVDGISAKMLVEQRVKYNEDILTLCRESYDTDLLYVMRELAYEMFYALTSGKVFHGDLHPGNVRILPNNRVAILDFGIRAEAYKDSVVPAVINKFQSDAKFIRGDFDMARILDAHFRLYMSSLYASIESLLKYQKTEMKEFFEGLASVFGIRTEGASKEAKDRWLQQGPAWMMNDMLSGGSERYGIEVRVKDQGTQRAMTTAFSLFKALGMIGEHGLESVYNRVCPRVMEERSELFGPKKYELPDLALENVYGWLEKLDSSNPEVARKVRGIIEERRRFHQPGSA